MKLLFCFLIVSSNLFFSQKIDSSNIKCSYHTKFLVDTANSSTLKEELVGLWIGDKTSLFKSDHKAVYDSLAMISADNSFKSPVGGKVILDFSNVPRAHFIPEVYKKDNEISIFDKIFNVNFDYKSDQKINWVLTKEEKVISSYKCKKAVGKYRNRKITAWYTNEIPIPEGPYTFKGLPGLVIEAYDEKDYIHFTLVSLKKTKKPIVTIRNSISTDYQKFAKKRSDFQKDPVGAFFIATGRATPKEQQERIIKLHRSKNNFLD